MNWTINQLENHKDLHVVVPNMDNVINNIFSSEQLREEVMKLNQEVFQLMEKNENLGKNVLFLMEENKDLKSRLSTLEEKETLRDALLETSDLATLYVRYIVEPLLPQFSNNTMVVWRDFTDEYYRLKDNAEDSVISEQDFDNWINSLQNQLSVDLSDLVSFSCIRNSEVHREIRSATNQKIFIQEMEDNLNYLGNLNFQYFDLLNNMVTPLKTVRLRRYK